MLHLNDIPYLSAKGGARGWFGMPSLPLQLRNSHRALGYTFLASMTELPLNSLPMPCQLVQWHVPDAQVNHFLALVAVLTYLLLGLALMTYAGSCLVQCKTL